MTLLTGNMLPNLQNLPSTEGSLNLQHYANHNWLLLMAQGKDFNPTGATELAALAKISRELMQRSVKILALSLDTLAAHEELISDIKLANNTLINFPIATITADDAAKLLAPGAQTATTLITRVLLNSRALILADPNMTVRYAMLSDNTVGLHTTELLRVIDSLQLSDSARVATPANWQQGQDCLLDPALLDPEGAKQLQQTANLTSYIKTVKQPKLKSTKTKSKSGI